MLTFLTVFILTFLNLWFQPENSRFEVRDCSPRTSRNAQWLSCSKNTSVWRPWYTNNVWCLSSHLYQDHAALSPWFGIVWLCYYAANINIQYCNINLAGFFKKVIAKWTFCVQQFFSAKVAITNSKGVAIAFFLFFSFLPPSSFFFSVPFPSLLWFLELLGSQETCLLTPFHSNDCKFRQVGFQKID